MAIHCLPVLPSDRCANLQAAGQVADNREGWLVIHSWPAVKSLVPWRFL